MSVINQMLKDLEERSPEQSSKVTQPTHISPKNSPIKLVLLTTVSVLSLCFVSFYVWQLMSENQALKAEKNNTSKIAAKQNTADTMSDPAVKSSKKEMIATSIASSNGIAPKTLKQSFVTSAALSDESLVKQQSSNKEKQTLAQSTRLNRENDIPRDYIAANEHKSDISISKNSSTNVTPAPKPKLIEYEEAHGHTHPHVKKTGKAVVTSAAEPAMNKMSVSRRQLTADELAQQKLSQAEKALASKQISKAEKLFEDVIIIKPSDSQTRKRLAALWFGRQAYQDALNLLSQGIALDGKDKSLRELKARIHLKQGQVRAAVNTLKPLAKVKDEQYQIMLANTAQQAQQNDIAIDAYKMLISMQPDLGRWQLGLAVLYDKSSQFVLASKAYKAALTKNDLSISSEDFVKKRIEVLGQ